MASTQADTLRVQPWAQLAILLISAVTLIGGIVVDGFPLLAPVSISFTVLIAGTIAVFWVDRRGTVIGTRWLAVIPLLDIVATAVIAAPLSHDLQLASALVILPLSWLALAFDPISIVIGVILSASVPASHAVVTDDWPQAPVDWVPFVLAPVMMSVFAASAHIVGRTLRENQRATDLTMARLEEESRARAADVATMTAIEKGTEDAVVVFDRAGELLRINAKAKRLARHAKIDFRLPGLGDHRVFAADHLSPVTFPDRAVPTLIEQMLTIEHVAWLGTPGNQVAVHYRMFPISTDGEVVGAAIIAHDVTELVEAIEVRDRFLDSVGHELRTPLTVLLGETDLALMSDVPESVAQRLTAIDEAASRSRCCGMPPMSRSSRELLSPTTVPLPTSAVSRCG
ncbi:histidine kinase dimerization/phospho-acceptor domain-containing protein [Microbacterium sp. NPDC076895]|uniref:histidine kinase dimerization/phospho-acceptor domain-containing protein n=1 Tax=Microbacterium sp. NPDC076895 TaxID=3154957 RepID=UPI00342231D4